MSLGFDRSVTARLKADVSDYVAKMAVAGRATSGFVNNLDQSNSRMSTLVQTSLALGPALIPTLAAAAPAAAGLSSGLLVTAAAGGVFKLAMTGIGSALQAVNKYQLDPTRANLDAMQLQLQSIGPSGAGFVKFLADATPQLHALQNAARAGLFPGMESGITHLLSLMPEATDIVSRISTALGDLASRGAADLAGPEWQGFFDYLDTRAKPILAEMGHVIGNVALGLSNMTQAADPLTQTFGQDLVKLSADFEHWSSRLANDPGFQSFVDYVQRETPEVGKTLGSIAEALAAVVEAGAGVGTYALPVIRALADVLREVAQSPIGPELFAAAAALSALSRAVAIFKAVNGSAVLGALRGGAGPAAQRAATAETSAAAALAPITVGAVGSARTLTFKPFPSLAAKAGMAGWGAGRLAAVQGGGLLAGAALQYGASQLGGGTTAGGTALNIAGGAASGAAIGTMFGPGPGTAIGTGVGAAIGGIQSLMQSSAAASAAQKQLDDAAAGVAMSLNHETGAATAATRSALAQALANQSAFSNASKLGLGYDVVTKAAMGSKSALDQIKTAMTNNLPAGLDLLHTVTDLNGKIDEQRQRIKLNAQTQVVAGQSVQRMGSAVDEEGHSFRASLGPVDTARQAMERYSGATIGALNATLKLDGVALGRHAQWLAYNQSILDVTAALKQNGRTLDAHTAAGIANRQALNSEASAALQVAAGFKKGSDQQIAFLEKSRNQLYQQVQSFGLSKQAAAQYVDTILGIPKQWKTSADFDNVNALAKIRQMQYEMQQLRDKTIHINVQESGAVASGVGQIRGYAAGGPVYGGVAGKDSVPMLAMPGEYMVKKSSVDYYGQPLLDALNNRALPEFAGGGFVGAGGSGGQTVVVRNDPAVVQRLAAIERALGGRLKVDARVTNPDDVAQGVRSVASGAVNAHAALDGRLAAVDGAGN